MIKAVRPGLATLGRPRSGFTSSLLSKIRIILKEKTVILQKRQLSLSLLLKVGIKPVKFNTSGSM